MNLNQEAEERHGAPHYSPKPGRNGPGRLYVFEGIDCCGKDTQADLLQSRLIRAGRAVHRVNLPDRRGTYGREIDAWLQPDRFAGKDPALVKRFIGILYQCDNLHTTLEARALLEAGVDVVLVRYVLSSVVYQRDQSALMPLILQNFEQFMPKPDATVFMDVSPAESVRRKAARGGPDEFYDGKLDKMTALSDAYRRVLCYAGDRFDNGPRVVTPRNEDGMVIASPRPAEEYLGAYVLVDEAACLRLPHEIEADVALHLALKGAL